MSENCFHDLNSHNKFSLHRQNKIVNCVHNLFYFCEWRNNSCNTYSFLTFFGRTVFTPSMSVQCACRTLCFHAPAPVQMPLRLGFADKKCSFFTVKNFTEQMFQVHKNWEMGHFSDPDYSGDGPWPSRTKQGPQTAHFIFLVGQLRGVFSLRWYPRHGPFSRLAPPKGKSCDRPCDSMVCNDVLLPR